MRWCALLSSWLGATKAGGIACSCIDLPPRANVSRNSYATNHRVAFVEVLGESDKDLNAFPLGSGYCDCSGIRNLTSIGKLEVDGDGKAEN
ncbi:MAG: hypothetical protein M9944_00565 [Rhizobiaceae bacterium]|nr:hypothetical protein [Rhizobiaceae bacterium]